VAKAAEGNAEAMRSAVASQRQVVSGVSLDEEMTNLITFQRGYEASARTLTTMDQLLETLIEHTGTAGL
jgi:flagellar hook-associated protein 1 FlgK